MILLLEVLKTTSDYEVTFDLAVQLQKSPDPDKKYIKDCDCKELVQQTLTCCCEAFRNILRRHAGTAADSKRNDYELVNLILEVNKMYRKCLKQIPGKESCFAQVMTEVYKVYVEDKVRKWPEHFNVQELAIKFCNAEINRRKNAEKGLPLGPIQLPGVPVSMLAGSASAVPTTSGLPNLPRSTTISVAGPGGGGISDLVGNPVVKQNSSSSKVAVNSGGQGAVNASGSNSGGGLQGKGNRGRPVGSKSVGNANAMGAASAAAMKQMMASMDPNMLKNMSALMGMYGSPAMVSGDEDVY